MSSFDIILVGVGGQGVLTVAEIISQAAAEAGLAVSYYPSKGMAQRGGFVKAQVRLARGTPAPTPSPSTSARGETGAPAISPDLSPSGRGEDVAAPPSFGTRLPSTFGRGEDLAAPASPGVRLPSTSGRGAGGEGERMSAATPALLGPNLPEHGAALAIALERSEALKALRFVRPGADFVLFDDSWPPAAVMLGKAAYPTTEQVTAQIAAAGARLVYAAPAALPHFEGKPVPDNVFVLGLAVGQTGLRDLLDPECVADLLRTRWPKAAQRNLTAFRAGLEFSVQNPPTA